VLFSCGIIYVNNKTGPVCGYADVLSILIGLMFGCHGNEQPVTYRMGGLVKSIIMIKYVQK